MNTYSFLADVVVAVHVAYVSTVVFGLLLILLGGMLRWKWVRNVYFRLGHLLLITIVVVEAILGIVCPLTEWESALRQKAGQSVEEGSFIGRFLHNAIFVDVPQSTLSVCYCLFGLLVLLSFWLVPPKWKFRRDKSDSQSEPNCDKNETNPL